MFAERDIVLQEMTDPQIPPVAPVPTPRRFTPPRPGESISSGDRTYILGPIVGEGHFGTVYEATDDWGNELVAKVLRPLDRSYDAVRASWEGELKTLVTLRHPNIAFLYAAFEYRDTFYLILERCSENLHSLINLPGLVPEGWLPWLARDILQAVHFMHGLGYVHKDIHPGNVFLHWQKDRMVTSKQPVLITKVGDLGISRLESDINIFGTVMAEWMLPPEYLDPTSFGIVGQRVDIYHAALLFLSLMLKAVPSFTREQVLSGAPREQAERLNSPFGPVLARALRRHTAERIPSALNFWHELRAVAFAA